MLCSLSFNISNVSFTSRKTQYFYGQQRNQFSTLEKGDCFMKSQDKKPSTVPSVSIDLENNLSQKMIYNFISEFDFEFICDSLNSDRCQDAGDDFICIQKNNEKGTNICLSTTSYCEDELVSLQYTVTSQEFAEIIKTIMQEKSKHQPEKSEKYNDASTKLIASLD